MMRILILHGSVEFERVSVHSYILISLFELIPLQEDIHMAPCEYPPALLIRYIIDDTMQMRRIFVEAPLTNESLTDDKSLPFSYV